MTNLQVTTVSSKGQVVIPNDIRQIMGLSEGAKMLVFTDGDHLLLKPIQAPRLETFKALIEAGRKFAKKNRLKKDDVKKLIKKVRHENRS